jgi:hypothetical protein
VTNFDLDLQTLRALPRQGQNYSSTSLMFYYPVEEFLVRNQYFTYNLADLLTSVGSFTSLFLGYNLRTLFGAIKKVLINKPNYLTFVAF